LVFACTPNRLSVSTAFGAGGDLGVGTSHRNTGTVGVDIATYALRSKPPDCLRTSRSYEQKLKIG